jgi:hypothetical protein
VIQALLRFGHTFHSKIHASVAWFVLVSPVVKRFMARQRLLREFEKLLLKNLFAK